MGNISDEKKSDARQAVSVVVSKVAATGQWAAVRPVLQHLLDAAKDNDADEFSRALDALELMASGRARATRGKKPTPVRGEAVEVPDRINELIQELEPRLGSGAPILGPSTR